MELDFILARKPTDNAFFESFNGRFRQERWNENWYLSLADAEEKVESCQRARQRLVPPLLTMW